jgi:hypothetical protein
LNDLPEINESRQLNDLAIAAGKKRQSTQTGFVHHFYHEADKAEHQTIPIVENFLFAFALLQSKTIEQMTEAKELIHKLLHFQNSKEGNFPIFIHEYPECKDRYTGAQLLPVIYYILNEFHNILGEELKLRLVEATKKLLKHCFNVHEEKEAPYPLALKIAASAQALGKFLHDAELEKKGSDLLEKYRKRGFHPSWCIPAAIADILLALQMGYGKLLNTPWKEFSAHIQNSWHKPSAAYVGPALRQYHQGKEPQAGLYDLFLGCLSDRFSNRSLKDSAFHLHAALIKVKEEKLPEIQYPVRHQGELGAGQWTIFQNEKYAYSLCEKGVLQNVAHENGFHPFYLVWGDPVCTNTFVNQGGNFETLSFICNENEIILSGQLSKEFVIEDREKCREQTFYFDVDPLTKITIHNMAASTFDIAESCVITNPTLTLSITTKLVEGDGQFLGHIMRGNRPSQIQLKGDNRFNAYDWQIFLRTLRRGELCKLQTTVKIESREG